MNTRLAYLCSACDAMCSAAQKHEPQNAEAWCCNCGRPSATYKALVVVDPYPALARAVEAWREVPEEDRRLAIDEVDTARDICGVHGVKATALHTALTRAADLLRAAGGNNG